MLLNFFLGTLRDSAKRHQFKQFLKKECSDEGLLFWLEIEGIKSMERKNSSRMPRSRDDWEYNIDSQKATQLFKTYIKDGSEFQINCDFEVKESIEKELRKGPPYTLSIFRDAQESVLQTMQNDSFVRFTTQFANGVLFATVVPGFYVPEVPKELFEKFLLECEESNGWEFVKMKNEVKIHTKERRGSEMKCLRSSLEMDFSADDILRVLTESDHKAFDSSLEKRTIVAQLGEGLKVVHHQYHGIPVIVNKRDFVALEMQMLDPERGYAVLYQSSEPNNIPVKKGVIRIEVESTGFLIVPLSARRSNLIFVGEIVPNGGARKIMLKMIRNFRALIVYRIKRLLEKSIK